MASQPAGVFAFHGIDVFDVKTDTGVSISQKQILVKQAVCMEIAKNSYTRRDHLSMEVPVVDITFEAEQRVECNGRAGMNLEDSRAKLRGFLARRSGRREDVGDLVQEVYLRFLQAPQRESLRQPLAYLYRIAANLLRDTHSRTRRGLVTYDSDLADEGARLAVDVWQDELGERLAAQRQLECVLRQLPATYRSVLLLRKRDGLSCSQIAQALGISKFTVEKYLYRAVAHFKRAGWDR